MEFAIKFGGDAQDVTITTSGAASVEGFKLASEALQSDPRFRPGLAILIDQSALTHYGMSADDEHRAAEVIMERDWVFRPRAIAIVVSNQHSYEMVRLAVDHLSVLQTQRRVFFSREEALAWLRQQKSLDG